MRTWRDSVLMPKACACLYKRWKIKYKENKIFLQSVVPLLCRQPCVQKRHYQQRLSRQMHCRAAQGASQPPLDVDAALHPHDGVVAALGMPKGEGEGDEAHRPIDPRPDEEDETDEVGEEEAAPNSTGGLGGRRRIVGRVTFGAGERGDDVVDEEGSLARGIMAVGW